MKYFFQRQRAKFIHYRNIPALPLHKILHGDKNNKPGMQYQK